MIETQRAVDLVSICEVAYASTSNTPSIKSKKMSGQKYIAGFNVS